MKLLLGSVVSLSWAIPSVIWHGMGDKGNSAGMRRIADMITSQTGNYAKSLVIGENDADDRANGFLMPVFDQVDYVCDIIQNDPQLKDGYHAVGFSQGAQFLRGVAQKCPSPPMINFISIHGQHEGVYGFPGCDVEDYPEICDLLRRLLDLAYLPEIQSRLVQAQYWHDPVHENGDTYRRNSEYIAPINNDVREGYDINQDYKTNLMKLQKFVMVKGEKDITVLPNDTSWFGFYADGSDTKLLSLQEGKIYQADVLGLAEMDKDGKLVFKTTPGGHMSFSDAWFISDIIPYLQ